MLCLSSSAHLIILIITSIDQWKDGQMRSLRFKEPVVEKDKQQEPKGEEKAKRREPLAPLYDRIEILNSRTEFLQRTEYLMFKCSSLLVH